MAEVRLCGRAELNLKDLKVKGMGQLQPGPSQYLLAHEAVPKMTLPLLSMEEAVKEYLLQEQLGKKD